MSLQCGRTFFVARTFLGALLVGTLFANCATGPRPAPASLSPEQRFNHMEKVLVSLSTSSLGFEVEAKGAQTMNAKGTLEMSAVNQVYLVADGTFDKDSSVHLEVDSRRGPLVRTLAKGSSADSHQDPPASAITESLLIGLSRLGLAHNLTRLGENVPLEHSAGGLPDWVKVTQFTDGGSDTASGISCRRVNYTYIYGDSGENQGTGSVCISDTTSLPLQRTTNLNTPGKEVQITERYQWRENAVKSADSR